MAKTTTNSKPKPYENNPFFVATNGLDLLFKRAQSVGIALAILAALSFLSSVPSLFTNSSGDTSTTQTASQQQAEAQKFADAIAAIPLEVWLIAGSIGLLILLIVITVGIVIRGVADFTSAQLANGKDVTLSEAFRSVFSNFWGYTWVMVVVGVKVFLWTLLFIIPGFVMAYRYSLSGVAFFENKLRGNAATKHSAALTKGAWLTTYASQNLLNLLTFGAIAYLLAPGTNGVLYRQLTDAGKVKPKAHVLSWLTLIIPFVLLVLIIVVAVSLAILLFSMAASGELKAN